MRRRPRWTLLAAIGLVPLIVLLAGLQYTWIGELSAAEATRKATFLASATATLTEALNLEVQTSLDALQPSFEMLRDRDWTGYPARIAAYRAGARYPDLPKQILLVRSQGTDGEVVLRWSFAKGVFEPAVLDEQERKALNVSLPRIHAVGDRLFLGGRRSLIAMERAQVPSTHQVQGAMTGEAVMVLTGGLVVELDADLMVETLLPDLLARHLGASLSEYVVRLIRPGGKDYVYFRGDPPPAPTDPDRVVVLFPAALDTLPALRETVISAGQSVDPGSLDPRSIDPGSIDRILTLESRSADPIWINGSRAIRIVTTGGTMGEDRIFVAAAVPGEQWLLTVSHRAGSLAAAVRAVRIRNLAISFGILLVLGAGAILLARALERSQEVARREREFVATVSHELKTPLGVILAVGQNLEAGIVTGQTRAQEYGATIGAEGARLRGMIEKILLSARLRNRASPGTAPARPLDPDVVVDETLRRIAAFPADGPAAVERTRRAHGVSVACDPAALASIVENLVVNASLHGRPAEGPITLESYRGRLRGRPAWALEVQDQGPGLPRAERARVFEPFVRGERATREQVAGSGLGLHIAREQARALGGEVDLVAPRLRGARFRLRLPLARA